MRTKVIILLNVLLLQFTAACAPSTQNIQGEKWVAFSGEQAEKLDIPNWYIEPDKAIAYWTPTESDIRIIESGLASYLLVNSDRFFSDGLPVWERLDEYNRQYLGIIIEGKHIIYGNFFCDSAGYDWRNKFVIVMDGGDCFFQFKYDVDSGEFFDLQVNGSA